MEVLGVGQRAGQHQQVDECAEHPDRREQATALAKRRANSARLSIPPFIADYRSSMRFGRDGKGCRKNAAGEDQSVSSATESS